MQWVCLVCGYVHDEEDEPPGMCPVCGAPASQFEQVADEDMTDDTIDDSIDDDFDLDDSSEDN